MGSAFRPSGIDSFAPRIILTLLRQMQRCRDSSCLSDSRSCAGQHVADGHKKHAGLLQYRPEYFWAVGPNKSRLFRVKTVRNAMVRWEEEEQVGLSYTPAS